MMDMGSMMNSMMGGMMGIGLLGWVLVIALLAAIVVLLVGRVAGKHDDRGPRDADSSTGHTPPS
jgi:uncharacterized membrane protein